MPASSVAIAIAPPERVDFLDQVALADAADRGVAGHLPERLDVVGEQQRARAHARGGERGFGAGMAAADDDHVETIGEIHSEEHYRRVKREFYAKAVSRPTGSTWNVAGKSPCSTWNIPLLRREG